LWEEVTPGKGENTGFLGLETGTTATPTSRKLQEEPLSDGMVSKSLPKYPNERKTGECTVAHQIQVQSWKNLLCPPLKSHVFLQLGPWKGSDK
jgi:hypothetical protein